ncbi:hypothetical protein ACHAW5_004500 [Stephanodiscus triporus]|uniref:Protochlorophyllide reductase n=1 Tax=Stephanodiscus triporus TaxID=2934178 RepID=A0ABD3Q6H1_9STRA
MKQAFLLSLALSAGIAAAWTSPTPNPPSIVVVGRSRSSSSFELTAAVDDDNNDVPYDDPSLLRRRDFFRSTSARAVSISLLAATASYAADAAASDAVPYSRIYRPAPHSMDGKIVVVTGGNAGLGLESAKRLAEAGASVVFTSRDGVKGARALEEANVYLQGLRASDPTFAGRVAVASLDLCDMANVVSFKDRLASVIGKDAKIDVLLNNAGVMAIPEKRLTKDGYEQTFQTNHLGHFALTSTLMPILSPKARIINVSSMAYLFVPNGLEMDNLNGEREYGPWSSYGLSKLENILFTNELQRRARRSRDWSELTAFSLHPGAVQTDLARYLIGEEKFRSMKEDGFSSWTEKVVMEGLAKFTKTVQEGASTQVYLAAADVSPEVAGSYFSDGKVTPVKAFALDQAKAEELWAVSEKLSGVKFDL